MDKEFKELKKHIVYLDTGITVKDQSYGLMRSEAKKKLIEMLLQDTFDLVFDEIIEDVRLG